MRRHCGTGPRRPARVVSVYVARQARALWPSWPQLGAALTLGPPLPCPSSGARPELPPVLKGLSFRIEAKEKVGICGRTGEGLF